MKEIKKEHKNVNFNEFTFSPRFQCLSTFQEDIKDKNLEHEEIQELLKFSGVLLIKGFVYTQIGFQCTQKNFDDSFYARNLRSTSITKESFDLFINILYRIRMFDPIFKVP